MSDELTMEQKVAVMWEYQNYWLEKNQRLWPEFAAKRAEIVARHAPRPAERRRFGAEVAKATQTDRWYVRVGDSFLHGNVWSTESCPYCPRSGADCVNSEQEALAALARAPVPPNYVEPAVDAESRYVRDTLKSCPQAVICSREVRSAVAFAAAESAGIVQERDAYRRQRDERQVRVEALESQLTELQGVAQLREDTIKRLQSRLARVSAAVGPEGDELARVWEAAARP